MKSTLDHHTSHSDTKREGEAQTPEAGRDIERPRGGLKGPLLALGLLAGLVIIGVFIAPIIAG
jgi:hypothetical protein